MPFEDTCLPHCGEWSPRPVFIHSLPAELLSKIFVLVIKPSTRRHKESNEPPKSPTLVRLSRVCKRWRDISLDDSLLWASAIEVDYNKLGWLMQLVKRSKTAPLEIRSIQKEAKPTLSRSSAKKRMERKGPNGKLHYSAYALLHKARHNTFKTRFWRHIFDRIDHWKCFDIRLSTDVDHEPLWKALTRSAPRLEDFRIDHDDKSIYHDLPQHLFILPDNLFNGDAPRLRMFSCAVFFLPASFDFSIWKNLTSLEVMVFERPLITNGRTSRAPILSARKWLEILSQTKQLQHLRIKWVDGGDCSTSMPVDSRVKSITHAPDVHLRDLRALDLMAGCGDILSDVFSKLFIPETCATRIGITLVETAYDRHSVVLYNFERIRARIERLVMDWNALKRPLRLDIMGNHYEEVLGFGISAMDDPDEDSSVVFPPFLHSSLQFSYKYRSENLLLGRSSRPMSFAATLKDIADTLACSRIFALGFPSLMLQDNKEKDALRDFLLGLKDVTTVIVPSLNNFDMLEVLYTTTGFVHPAPRSSNKVSPEIVLPNLTFILYVVECHENVLESYVNWWKIHRAPLPEPTFRSGIKIKPVMPTGSRHWRSTRDRLCIY